MISLGRLLSNSPIPVFKNIYFHQSTIQEIIDMGESMYWSLLKMWDLRRDEMIQDENEQTKALSDLDLYKLFVFNSPDMRNRFIASIDLFLHTKVEFLPISNTIMIGEDDSRIMLDESFYFTMREISQSISNLGIVQKEEQYKETENMSEREKAMIKKMQASQEKLNKIKNGDQNVENQLAKQIISLVAIGHYTFDEVYNMTIVQMIYLLKKYVEIQQYELYTSLSPYMDSKKNESPKHWVDT